MSEKLHLLSRSQVWFWSTGAIIISWREIFEEFRACLVKHEELLVSRRYSCYSARARQPNYEARVTMMYYFLSFVSFFLLNLMCKPDDDFEVRARLPLVANLVL